MSSDQRMMARSDIPALVARAEALASAGNRRLLAIVGAPGSGKSTLGQQLVDSLGPERAVLVGMDGFHFAQQELERTGLTPVKGAIETFDVGGLLSLLRRLHEQSEDVVYAPVFRRDLEEPIGSAQPVRREVPLVIVEGNYLLADTDGWRELGELFDETWYLDLDEDTRLDRLISRHMDFGRTREQAVERSNGSDQRNADLIFTTRSRADVVVQGAAN